MNGEPERRMGMRESDWDRVGHDCSTLALILKEMRQKHDKQFNLHINTSSRARTRIEPRRTGRKLFRKQGER